MMYTERIAIQDELHDNRRQIKEIRDRNGDLLKRLREIDERDMKDEVSYDGLNTLTNSLTEILGKMSDLIPSVSPSQIIEHIANQVDSDQVEVAAAKEKEPTNIEKAVQKAKLQSAPVGLMSKERAATIIKEIIGEFGIIKANKLEDEFYKRTGKKYVNFSEQIRKAMELSPMITKAGFGKYTLAENNSPSSPFNENKEEELVLS